VYFNEKWEHSKLITQSAHLMQIAASRLELWLCPREKWEEWGMERGCVLSTHWPATTTASISEACEQ